MGWSVSADGDKASTAGRTITTICAQASLNQSSRERRAHREQSARRSGVDTVRSKQASGCRRDGPRLGHDPRGELATLGLAGLGRGGLRRAPGLVGPWSDGRVSRKSSSFAIASGDGLSIRMTPGLLLQQFAFGLSDSPVDQATSSAGSTCTTATCDGPKPAARSLARSSSSLSRSASPSRRNSAASAAFRRSVSSNSQSRRAKYSSSEVRPRFL